MPKMVLQSSCEAMTVAKNLLLKPIARSGKLDEPHPLSGSHSNQFRLVRLSSSMRAQANTILHHNCLKRLHTMSGQAEMLELL